MARIARIVCPGMPHHVTQRGNRRQQTFFNDDYYQSYQMLMSEWCKEYGVELEKNGVIFYQNIRMKLTSNYYENTNEPAARWERKFSLIILNPF